MRILLVEDDVLLAKSLRDDFYRNKYSVDAVQGEMETLIYFENGDYDCVLICIKKPTTSGFSILKRLREISADVPIMLVSAKQRVDEIIAGLDLGADDFLVKPFYNGELFARLRAITRRKTGGKDSLISFGDLTLNRARFTISTASGEIRLTNKEYQIMEMLVCNGGQVVSTQELMKKIWGYSSDGNAVWVYASHLRNKIVKLGSKVIVKAMRNEGYRLEMNSSVVTQF
ncbi:MAG: response regulator transcription factor [Clostridia bacterium]|nr:response regulator transcription factor [Clostridia bacterium]